MFYLQVKSFLEFVSNFVERISSEILKIETKISGTILYFRSFIREERYYRRLKNKDSS